MLNLFTHLYLLLLQQNHIPRLNLIRNRIQKRRIARFYPKIVHRLHTLKNARRTTTVARVHAARREGHLVVHIVHSFRGALTSGFFAGPF